MTGIHEKIINLKLAPLVLGHTVDIFSVRKAR